LFIGLAVGTCRQPLGPGAFVTIEVLAVTAGDPTIVGFTLRNSSDETLYVARCGPEIETEVDQAVGASWRVASVAGCDGPQTMADLDIQRGATLRSTRGLYGHGRFRLRVGVRRNGERDYDWTASSGGFDVP
jgi:hypothetical protein